jgi:hypothetical protein
VGLDFTITGSPDVGGLSTSREGVWGNRGRKIS